jgi:predicted secreted acid phosphatase
MGHRTVPVSRFAAATALAVVSLVVSSVAPAAASDRGSGSGAIHRIEQLATRQLAPRTHFEMQPDGSSGLRADGAGIPNVDSVKSTIRTYYGADSTGIANKVDSPYISELDEILGKTEAGLDDLYAEAQQSGAIPAIVFDADDTTLWTYDMEDHDMHFVFDPALQNVWVQDQRFPATPGMVAFVQAAEDAGFAIFGLTGRNDGQKAATLGNLAKVGYTAFDADNFYTKFVTGTPVPSYLTCAAVTTCNTVEFKAGTRAHIESLGYDIALNIGDQWSDLQGGFADHVLKLPNPTYYLPSPDLPGLDEPELAPRTRFTMAPDGSSGRTEGGEGIPNIDSVKSTIRTYYGADATGIANKQWSPYISELAKLNGQIAPVLDRACAAAASRGLNPAIVLDADDTTLWTYDMEDHDMHFVFDPALQNVWVQEQRFPATPQMVDLANGAAASGCTLIGLTGRNDTQRAATLANLAKVGFDAFTEANYYTKFVTGTPVPDYLTCAAVTTCTTIEYKSGTRAHAEDASGGGYTILANFGDQFSDLIGGHAIAPIKLPNPTYYLP